MPSLEYDFILITGPSCVGKSPLRRAFFRHYEDLTEGLSVLTLYTSRAPRSGEEEGKQYYFRSREEIRGLKKQKDFVVEEVRGDLQAVDLRTTKNLLNQGKRLLYEGNPFIAKKLVEELQENRIKKVSIYLSPLSRVEVERFLSMHSSILLRRALSKYMQQKLLNREKRYKSQLGLSDYKDIEMRAESAFDELQLASDFDMVLPNHDGEDSNHWEHFGFPIGDARKILEAFVSIIQGGEPTIAESWDPSLFSD